ncbi:hypothetical protein F5Y15DRAFT_394112 [Xylariaceae sp. FL0016]|nr:hypothetical protein F5Y15DRAFT_394112 [Xylariaceae sp. FL0016]
MRRNGIDIERQKAFTCRLLADFAFQWRHILGGRYNQSTFQKLATAIIRIVTLDFNVQEATTPRQGNGGYHIWLHSLPEWESFSGHIVRVGGVSIVLSQHPRHAVTLIRNDYQEYIISKAEHRSSEASTASRTYFIVSIREVMFYRIDSESERCTSPERLFDGTLPPSNAAMEQLLEAVQNSGPMTTLNKLPVEVQDGILDYVSVGPIQRAVVGCLLNIGSPFTWRCAGRDIEREESHRSRTPWTPVESRVYFSRSFSGIVYK